MLLKKTFNLDFRLTLSIDTQRSDLSPPQEPCHLTYNDDVSRGWWPITLKELHHIKEFIEETLPHGDECFDEVEISTEINDDIDVMYHNKRYLLKVKNWPTSFPDEPSRFFHIQYVSEFLDLLRRLFELHDLSTNEAPK